MAVAVSLCLASGMVTAQTNITGNAYGQVQAGPGVSIVFENVATGFKRTLSPDATGRFFATSFPTGTYKATLMRDGKVEGVSQEFEIFIGRGTEVTFAAPQTVVVTGRPARIDVTSSNNGSTFVAKELDALPIAHNLDAIIQLAPNTTRVDSRYPGGASFGGGAPSENSYYINGFPVTNPLNQLGASELPFGAIAQAQILTGGFGAEFGRSIGGVANITTKSGSNTWEGGVSASYTPSSMRSTYKDINYAVTGDPANASTDGTLYRRNSDRETTQYSLAAYLGGPLIKDELFMFAALEQRVQKDARTALNITDSAAATSGWSDRKSTNDRYLFKFDWSPVKNHLLEATFIGDTYKRTEANSGYDYATGARNGIVVSNATYIDNQNFTPAGVGADSQILRYTGFLTDDLTITALYGQSKSSHINELTTTNGYSINGNVMQSTVQNNSARYPGITYFSPFPFPGGTLFLGQGAEDTVKAGRFDLEYRIKDHLIRAGIDEVRLESKNAGDFLAGNGWRRYQRTSNPNLRPDGATITVGSAGGLTQILPACVTATNPTGVCYYYGREQIFTDVTNAGSNQSAFYVEDRWQVNKDFLFTPGLRVEKYYNTNGDGETFLKIETQVHPRLAFAWDMLGDASTKLFGSAGRYGVQIPTHLAVRGASRSTFTRRDFVYSGVDANGAPINPVYLGPPFSANNEYGQPKDAKTVSAQDLKPNSQDELTLGIERALTDRWTGGARVTYRRLAATIDDLCDPRPFDKYAADNGIDVSNYGGFGCASFNPGMANKFLIDYSGVGNYTTVNLSKEALGFDSAKRTYFALDFFLEHPKRDGWWGRVNYTYSKSQGNTEGQTLSDVAQTDVAATQTWDHPELMIGAYGYLPNDRRHQIKAFGSYDLTSEWELGANFLAASGRPKNCIGNWGGPEDPLGVAGSYGAAYRYCAFNGVSEPRPRGSEGYLPWDVRLDMALSYRPQMIKGLGLRVEVFNLFNKQTVEVIDEIHENNFDTSSVIASYGRVVSYTAPRAVKFSMTYDMKF